MKFAIQGPYTYAEPCVCPACLAVLGLVRREAESIACTCGWTWRIKIAAEPQGVRPGERFFLVAP